MTRPIRVHFEGAVFHVMARGNGGQDIFLTDGDYQRFLMLLIRTRHRFLFKVYAYCLMPNHIHLVVRVGQAGLSDIMHALLTWYANAFNVAQRRTGHLFQNRYKAILCSDDSYLLTLIRYIHHNPGRAGLARTPGDWPWTSHQEYLGQRVSGIVDAEFPLRMFHSSMDIARAAYEQFLQDDPGTGRINPTNRGAKVDATEIVRSGDSTAVPARVSIQDLAETICAESGVVVETLRGESQTHRLAATRRTFVQRALQFGLRPMQIAQFLNRSPALVAKYGRVEKSETGKE